MKRTVLLFIVFSLLFGSHFLSPSTVYAVCPVCTIAVAGGLGLSRWLGIDDSITGIWVGGLIVSLSFWTADWVSRKKYKFLDQLNYLAITVIAFILWALLTFPPLYWTNIIGHPYNTILGVDKLLFGSVIGTVAFLLGVLVDKKVRKIKGKQLFNYQKVVFPVSSLALASLLVYYYGGYLY